MHIYNYGVRNAVLKYKIGGMWVYEVYRYVGKWSKMRIWLGRCVLECVSMSVQGRGCLCDRWLCASSLLNITWNVIGVGVRVVF